MKLRKNIRLKHYDYSTNGYYFVTIHCSYVAAKRQLCLNYNKTIENHLQSLSEYKGVKLDYYKIMPTHIHIILILEGTDKSLPQLIQYFKSKSTLDIKNNGFNEKRFWQPNYYEHIIRNENALTIIRGYIDNNAYKEKIDVKQFYNVAAERSSAKACNCKNDSKAIALQLQEQKLQEQKVQKSNIKYKL